MAQPWGGQGSFSAGSSDSSVQRLTAAITKAIESSSVAGRSLGLWADCLPVRRAVQSCALAFAWLLRRAKGDRKPDGETGIPILNTFLVFDTEFLQLESQIIKKILEEGVVTVSVYGFCFIKPETTLYRYFLDIFFGSVTIAAHPAWTL